VYDLAERALPVHLECTCSTLTVTFACADWRVVTVIHKWAETRPESGPAAFPSRSLDRNNRNARCRIVSPFTRVSPPGSHVSRTRGNGGFRFRTPPEIPRIPALAFSLERIHLHDEWEIHWSLQWNARPNDLSRGENVMRARLSAAFSEYSQ